MGGYGAGSSASGQGRVEGSFGHANESSDPKKFKNFCLATMRFSRRLLLQVAITTLQFEAVWYDLPASLNGLAIRNECHKFS